MHDVANTIHVPMHTELSKQITTLNRNSNNCMSWNWEPEICSWLKQAYLQLTSLQTQTLNKISKYLYQWRSLSWFQNIYTARNRSQNIRKWSNNKEQFASGELHKLIGKNKKQSVIKFLQVTKPSQFPVPVNNKRQPQQLILRPPSPSALPVTRPAPFPAPVNKLPSKQYYRRLTPRPTCQSESSADTNFPSKRSHRNALLNLNIGRRKKESR